AITESNSVLTIDSPGLPFNLTHAEIHSGNSGITTHFVMPLLGLRQNSDQPIILNCSEQMRSRPIQSLVNALNQLGLNITYLENINRLPIQISGKLIGGKTEVDGMTSQYLSALLLALPCAKTDSEITVRHLQERSYVDITLHYLKNQHIQFKHVSLGEVDLYQIKGQQSYKNFNTNI